MTTRFGTPYADALSLRRKSPAFLRVREVRRERVYID